MTRTAPLATVLMATYNGAEFLGDQLQSINQQSHGNWRLVVADDGSTDATLAMLETFRADLDPGTVVITQGPRRGATANFLNLLSLTDPGCGFVFFCDQDDVWLPYKVERAIIMIGKDPRPALYACASMLCDAAGRVQRPSKVPGRPLGLHHALAENVLTGNSMVMNEAAAGLVRAAVLAHPDRPLLESGYHDWFAYQVIADAGGRILFDPQPGLLYRQHGANLVGSGQAKGRVWHRVSRVLGGEYSAAIRRQALALRLCPTISAESRQAAANLLSLRGLKIWQRPDVMRQLGLYRQSRLENLLLKVLLLIGRV